MDRLSWELSASANTASTLSEFLEMLSEGKEEPLGAVAMFRDATRVLVEQKDCDGLARLVYEVGKFVRTIKPEAVRYRCRHCGADLADESADCICTGSNPGDVPRVVAVETLLRPHVLQTTFEDLEILKFVQIRRHRDWPAVFSCNSHGQVWVFETYGYTPQESRREVRTALLATVVDVYLSVRPTGGRFFVNEHGAYFQPRGELLRQFVRFEISDRHVHSPGQVIGQDAVNLVRANVMFRPI